MDTFAQRLKDLRAEKNLLQAELAAQIGVSGKTISSYEQANSEPNFEILTKLASFFNVSTDYLLGLSNYKKEINQAANIPLPEKTIEMLRDYSKRIDPMSNLTMADVFGALISDDKFEFIFSYAFFYITSTDDTWNDLMVSVKQNDPKNPIFSQVIQQLSKDFLKSNVLNTAADRLKALIISLQESYPNF